MASKRIRWVIIGAIVVMFGAAAWWLGSPLFLDRVADEDFHHDLRAPGWQT